MAISPDADSQGLWLYKEGQVCSGLRLEGTNSGCATVPGFEGSGFTNSATRNVEPMNLYTLTKKSSTFRHIKEWIEDYFF